MWGLTVTIKSLFHLPIEMHCSADEAIISQRVGDLPEEVVTIRVTKDQAKQIGEFLTKAFNTRTKKQPPSGTENFDAFWSAYPRKEAKAKAEQLWAQKHCDKHAAVIMQHVEEMKMSRQWQEGFVPHASTYLNQRRWEDAVDSGSSMDDSQFV